MHESVIAFRPAMALPTRIDLEHHRIALDGAVHWPRTRSSQIQDGMNEIHPLCVGADGMVIVPRFIEINPSHRRP